MYEDTYNQKEILQNNSHYMWHADIFCSFVCAVHTWGSADACTHMRKPEQRMLAVFLHHSVLPPWDRVSHWTRSSHLCLGKQADELSASAPSFSMLGLQAGRATLSSFFHLCWGFELRSSWWQSNCLSPLSNLSSPHFLFLFIKNKFISRWISGSISGLPPTVWKLQLCVEEF